MNWRRTVIFIHGAFLPMIAVGAPIRLSGYSGDMKTTNPSVAAHLLLFSAGAMLIPLDVVLEQLENKLSRDTTSPLN